MKTVLDVWLAFRGYQGGTLADALREFRSLPLAEQDRFCTRLAGSLGLISDVGNARAFMAARMDSIGLASVPARN
jgi:hypothetical protein